MDYILHLVIFVSLYVMLAQTLNLAAGQSGLLSLAHASFFGIGAYATAILSTCCGYSWWFNLICAMLVCGSVAFVVSLISLRAVEDYFVISTLGIQSIIYAIMNNWMQVTNGPAGIPGIPPITIGNYSGPKGAMLMLSLVALVLIWLFLRRLFASGFGKTLVALSEDEVFTQAVGKNVYASKVISFTLSATLAAIPGVLYAHYISFVSPDSFSLDESILILSMVIIGGMGKLTGSFMAAAFMILLPELLRYLGLPDTVAANLRQIVFGMILVLITMFKNKNMPIASRKRL